MLYDLDNNPVTQDPHSEEFSAWRREISDEDYQAMVDAINAYCDRCQEYFCSSWMPGNDSTIRAAFPPLAGACGGSEEQSGFFFGNIVWRVLCERDDEWHFRPADKEGGDAMGMMYWRKTK